MTVKYLAALAVIMLSMFSVSSLLVVGGSLSMDYSYDDEGNITVRNTSFGLFTNATWDVRDFAGNKLKTDGETSAWFDVGYPSTEESEFKDPTNVIMASSPSSLSTQSISWKSEEPNVFRVTLTLQTYAGNSQKITKDVAMDGVREYTVNYNFEYTLSDIKYILAVSIDVEVDTSDFLHYRNEKINRAPGESVNINIVKRYTETISSSNNAVERIISQLIQQAPAGDDVTDEIYANYVLAFAQNITYVSDIRSVGASEYWKFPIETLFANAGDCEDTSMLSMILFKMFFKEVEGKDISTALLIYWGEGHAMAAISLDDTPATPTVTYAVSQDTKLGYVVNGKTYYVCETTSKGWSVGWLPSQSYASYSHLRTATPDHIFII